MVSASKIGLIDYDRMAHPKEPKPGQSLASDDSACQGFAGGEVWLVIFKRTGKALTSRIDNAYKFLHVFTTKAIAREFVRLIGKCEKRYRFSRVPWPDVVRLYKGCYRSASVDYLPGAQSFSLIDLE